MHSLAIRNPFLCSHVCTCLFVVHCHRVVYLHYCELLFERDRPLQWIARDSAGLENAVRLKQAGKKEKNSCLGFKELEKCLCAQVSISGRELLC